MSVRTAGAVLVAAIAGCTACSSETSPEQPTGSVRSKGAPQNAPKGTGKPEAYVPSTPETPLPKKITGKANRIALLVGIQDYPKDIGEFDQLSGPHNDVPMVREMLVRRFGFPEANVHVLMDENATLANIVGAIRNELIEKSGPETEAFLYFSCHGSRVRDESGKEKDDMDSSIVAYDSRTEGRRGSRDLTDDALYSLMRELTSRGARVAAVTDACHSGSGLRSAGRRGGRRFAEKGTEVAAPAGWNCWPKDVPFLDDHERPATELSNYVHLAACSAHQTAYEFDYGEKGGGTHGIFTFCFVQAMRRAQPGRTTWRDIARRTAAIMGANPSAPAQSLRREGDGLDRELFRGRFRPPPPGFAVTQTPASTVLEVAAGSIHGVVRGAELDVRDDEGREVGIARVISADFGDGMATFVERPKRRTPDTVLWATLRSVPRSQPKLKVLGSGAGLDQVEDWAELGSSRAMDADADYVLERGADGKPKALFTRDGIQVWPRVTTRSESPLREAFRKEAQFRALWGLASPETPGELQPLELRFVAANATDCEMKPDASFKIEKFVPAPPIERVEKTSAPEYRICVPDWKVQDDEKKGRLGILEFVNKSPKDVYIQVLSIGDNREVNIVWPTDGAGRVVKTGDARRVPVWLGSPNEGDWLPDRLLRERHLVIATVRPIDLRPFIDSETLRSGSKPEGPPPPGILQAAFDCGRMRSGGSVGRLARGWGVAWVDLLVENPK